MTSEHVLLTPLLGLARQLRQAGVAVSISETIDASVALAHVDLADRNAVRSALTATMVKRSEDLPAFELLFDLHFAIRGRREPGNQPTVPGISVRRDITTSLDRQGDESALAEDPLIDMIMDAIRRGDPDALRALAEMAVERFGGFGAQTGASERYFIHRILRALELSKLMREMLSAERAHQGDGPIDERRIRAELAERIEAFKRLIAAQVRTQLAELRGTEATAASLELLGTDEIDFLGASPRQLAAIRDAIRPLARALATRMARRRRRRDRGRLDVRRTVRRSLSSGGALLDPSFRKRKAARPDLYVLCDVSGSVAEFASFTLTLLQAMTAEFSRMRSFAFVDGIDEVTDHLKEVASFLEVRHVLYGADVIRADGHSDYGAVFERFMEHYAGGIDSRSTVLVTGDARANYREPRVEMLRAIRARARRVYLLNPEPEAEWNTMDSIVRVYEGELDGVFEVRNLRQLADAVYRIA